MLYRYVYLYSLYILIAYFRNTVKGKMGLGNFKYFTVSFPEIILWLQIINFLFIKTTYADF